MISLVHSVLGLGWCEHQEIRIAAKNGAQLVDGLPSMHEALGSSSGTM